MKKIFLLFLVSVIVFNCSACSENTNYENQKIGDSNMVDNDYAGGQNQNSNFDSKENIYDKTADETNKTSNENESNNLDKSDKSEQPKNESKPSSNNSSSSGDSENNKNSSSNTRTKEPPHVHSYSMPTCDKPATCECGATQGAPRQHYFGINQKTCSWCGAANPNYYETKTYTMGQKWVVDGEWEITFNSVTVHYTCNHYDPGKGQVVIINYTYKNIGYELNGLDLRINSLDMRVFDGNGEAADTYACTHTRDAKNCIIGMSCTAEEAYVLINNSSEITIGIDMHTTNDGRRKANFKLKF